MFFDTIESDIYNDNIEVVDMVAKTIYPHFSNANTKEKLEDAISFIFNIKWFLKQICNSSLVHITYSNVYDHDNVFKSSFIKKYDIDKLERYSSNVLCNEIVNNKSFDNLLYKPIVQFNTVKICLDNSITTYSYFNVIISAHYHTDFNHQKCYYINLHCIMYGYTICNLQIYENNLIDIEETTRIFESIFRQRINELLNLSDDTYRIIDQCIYNDIKNGYII